MTSKSLTLKEIAEITGSSLVGDPAYKIHGVADLKTAKPTDVSLALHSRYETAMKGSKAGAIFIPPSLPQPTSGQFLVCDDPNKAIQQIVDILYESLTAASGFSGIHPTAVVHPSTTLGHNVTLGPHVVIDENCKIGKNSFIGAGSYIGPNCIVGEETVLDPNVTLRQRCILGNRVVINSGCVLGTCGFGFQTDKMGRHSRLKHIGSVIVEDDVEIGANTTIDRARFASTKIARGTKIDNLVLIGHNVSIGEDNIIIGLTGIAGSASTGKHVVLAGQVGVAGHLHITDQVKIAGRGGVSKSVNKPGNYGGVPLLPIEEHHRNSVLLRKIQSFANDIKEIKARVFQVE